MAVRPVLIYPDPVLKMVAGKVDQIDDAIAEIIGDLTDTLEDSPGCVGIAAPQIGALKRIILIDLSRSTKPQPNQGRMLLINPQIEWQEGEVLGREGCLSLPDLTANVKRARQIRVLAKTHDWNDVVINAEDFEARVILHENDHLDGFLFLDRVASLKNDVFKRKRYLPPAQAAAAQTQENT